MAEEEILFELVGMVTIPRGIAVAIHNNRVLWMGPARVLQFVDVSEWPNGTFLNINQDDLGTVKDLVEQVEEGRPRGN